MFSKEYASRDIDEQLRYVERRRLPAPSSSAMTSPEG
jgi:hypothetical protein